MRRILSTLLVTVLAALPVVIVVQSAEAAASCTATSTRPTSHGGRYDAAGTGICTGVYRETITVCLQEKLTHHTTYTDISCITPTVPAPSDTFVGTGTSAACSPGAHNVRTKTVMRGKNSSGTVIATKTDFAPAPGSLTNCIG